MKDLSYLIELVGTITTIVAILMFFYALACWIFGIAPLLYRLGFARWKRKLQIVSSPESYSDLKSDLIKTGIFRDKNISNVTKASLNQLKDDTLVLIHYQYLTEAEIIKVLNDKATNSGYIFYFPEFNPPTNVVPNNIMSLINNQPFTTLVNFRGRLVNDLVITMISTGFKHD